MSYTDGKPQQMGLIDTRQVNQQYENMYNSGSPYQQGAGYASDGMRTSYNAPSWEYQQNHVNWQEQRNAQLRAESQAKYGDLAQYAPDGIIGGKDQAQDIRIALSRAEWEDYKKRFLPIEEELIGMVGNQELLGERIGRSQEAVNTAFAKQQQQEQEMTRRYGLQMSQQAQAHRNRKNNVMKAAAMADAANDTRRDYRSMEMEILGG